MESLFRKKKKNIFLGLDIGTESVKALFFSGKNILGSSVEYFDRHGILEGKDYKVSLLKKTVSGAFEKAKSKIPFSSLDKKEKKKALRKKIECLVTFSSEFLKTRVDSFSFQRDKEREKISLKEGREMKEKVLAKARKEISEKFSEKTGILGGEIEWLKEEIIEIKIDGYRVNSLEGYEGKNLDFKVLLVFSPEFYLKRIEKALSDFNIKGFYSPSCGLSKDGLFVDVGGEISQFFLVEGGILSKVGEFRMGGRDFSQSLSSDLGLEENLAREFKERYSRDDLSPDSTKKIKEIFSKQINKWYNSLREEINPPGKVFLFGGSSLLPDISNILKEEGGFEVELFSPGEIKNPQFTPLSLIVYAQ